MPPEAIPSIPTALDAYNQLDELDVEVVPAHFQKQTALARADGLLAIDYSKPNGSAEELELLLHEAGHFAVGAFYTPEDGAIQRARAETRATRHVFERFYPPQLLAHLIQSGDTEPWQLAERLCLPESFVREMLCFYTEIRQIDFSSMEPSASFSSSPQPATPEPTSPPGWESFQTQDGISAELLLSPNATSSDISAALQAIRSCFSSESESSSSAFLCSTDT